MEPSLTPDEVARILNIGKFKVHEMIENGQLEAVKLGHRTVRITPASVRIVQSPHTELGRRIMQATSAQAFDRITLGWAPGASQKLASAELSALTNQQPQPN